MQQLVRVFFTASHVVIALLIGYGLALVATSMSADYRRFRSWGLIGGAVATTLALLSFTEITHDTYFGEAATLDLSALVRLVVHTFTNKNQFGLPVFAGLLLLGLTAAYLVGLLAARQRAPIVLTLLLFGLMPVHSILTHWSDNEQRGHWFGYWFGHDMFSPPFQDKEGKPMYPEMTRNAVLFGGTDPGRFCPTYMIFCESFIPHQCQPTFDEKFDRRDVYIITQNALADPTYVHYIRAQYNRSAEKDVPFFQELLRSQKEREENYTTNLLARAVAPVDNVFLELGERIEKRRRTNTSWFTPRDFVDLPALARRLRPCSEQDPVSKFVYASLSPDTRRLLDDSSEETVLRPRLASDLNRLLEHELDAKRELASKESERSALDQQAQGGDSSPSIRRRQQQLDPQTAELSEVPAFYDPERFKQVPLDDYLADFVRENPRSHTRIRLNRLLLEAAYPREIAKSLGGVYPDREIYTPSAEDSGRCFQEYSQDADRRRQLNQLKPGEDIRVIGNRIQIAGQGAVMSINALLTKVIFDHNPKNEFFVEESFPLDWMYPYLSPYGIIMKINRQPVGEVTEQMVDRDHEFWSRYSERLIGNWITYDTSVKDIAAFVEKVYLRHDYSGFKGDRKFIRDDQAQKAFSKLRSSIGGLYTWRIPDPNNRSPAVQQRMIREADFALRQSFAFCPYSPEAVSRYASLLLALNRLDDALVVGETCLKLDPNNAQMQDLVSKLRSFRKGARSASLR
jgi:hypothetical protein